MKNYYKYISIILSFTCLLSCNHFDDINTNPDKSTSATPDLLATGLILSMTGKSGGVAFFDNQTVGKSVAWGNSPDLYQYNNFSRSGLDSYEYVINAQKMLDHAAEATYSGYEGLYFFTKAFHLFETTIALGDIPYTEAFQGESGNFKPKYDDQKTVMIKIFEDTERAYEAFSKGVKFSGDFIYGGDPVKWQKATRALQLKILINLSIKENDPDLKVKEKFNSLINSSLMESNADNLQRVYSEVEKETYPIYKVKSKSNEYIMVTDLIIEKLKETEDYRLFYYAEPSENIMKELEVDADDFMAYKGIDPSLHFDEISKIYNDNNFCNIGKRYTDQPEGEPIVTLGYAEQQFILAEATLRGWISGDVDKYYKEGVRAHMQFIADNTPDDKIYHKGRKITEDEIVKILNHPKMQLSANKETAIEQVLTQKYLSYFLQRGYDVYYDNRRTGYPKFPINPQTNLNIDKNSMPKRWMYSESEYGYNTDNVKEAVQRQWQGIDDVTKLMWILQK